MRNPLVLVAYAEMVSVYRSRQPAAIHRTTCRVSPTRNLVGVGGICVGNPGDGCYRGGCSGSDTSAACAPSCHGRLFAGSAKRFHHDASKKTLLAATRRIVAPDRDAGQV